VSKKTNRRLIAWDGCCSTHAKIKPEDILKEKGLHPKAEVMVHPECIPRVIELADSVFSTEGMCNHAKKSSSSEFIVGTETGILYRLRKENPEKKFYPASDSALCPTMKLITPEKVFASLRDMKYEVRVPRDIQIGAKRALDRMLEI
jgi:quinolinate synthase